MVVGKDRATSAEPGDSTVGAKPSSLMLTSSAAPEDKHDAEFLAFALACLSLFAAFAAFLASSLTAACFFSANVFAAGRAATCGR